MKNNNESDIEIKPDYPKMVLKQPYFKGIMLGFYMFASLYITKFISIWLGSFLILFGILVFYRQISSEYNFV